MMTNPAKRTPRGRKRQRGAALAVTGIAMIMILAMAVIGVDIGHVAFTANETQTLADLSATSYVKTLALNMDDGGSRDPVGQTGQVVANNFIGGAQATMGDNIESLQPGNYNRTTRVFTPDGTPVNAVRATAVATVPNFFAGLFGDFESTVTRQATAALVPPGRAPVLPLAIGDCQWDIFENVGDCSQQPNFTLVPDPSENACLTGLMGSADAQSVDALVRAYCGINNDPAPQVGVGDVINMMGGTPRRVLVAIQACLNAGITQFTIPVIPCRERTFCTGNDPVVDFATIDITSVVLPGDGGGTGGISAGSVCSTNPPGASGQGTTTGRTGTEIVGLVG